MFRIFFGHHRCAEIVRHDFRGLDIVVRDPLAPPPERDREIEIAVLAGGLSPSRFQDGPEDNDEPAVATDGTQRYVGEKLPPLRYTVPVADGDKTSIAQRELRLRSRKVRKEKNGDTRRSLQFILGRDYLTLVQRAMRHAGEPSRVRARVREIWGSGGSLEPPGRLHTRPPHSIYGIF